GLARILFVLVARQAQRILRFDIDAVDDDGQPAVVVKLHAELGVAQVLARGAVVTITIGGKPVGADHVIEGIGRPAGLDAVVICGIAARGGRRLYAGRRFAIFGEYLHDAARRIAVQRGKRAAQHFDARHRRDIDVRRLALPVRHGGGYAVDIQAHAAHAERRPRAEPAHRQLQVLRVVLAVLYLQAGHAAQPLGQTDAGRVPAQFVARHHVHRR